MSSCKKSLFSIDGLGNIYEGYTFGQHWNGWACPYFTKDVAMEIIDDLQKDDTGVHCWYINEIDAFIVDFEGNAEYDALTIEYGEGIECNGEKIKVYGLGAFSWVWDEMPLEGILKNIVFHNGEEMEMASGDQNMAENLYVIEHEGTSIYNFFQTECLRFEVNPLEYYGYDNLLKLAKKWIGEM